MKTVPREDTQELIKKNNQEYTKYFDLFMAKKIERDEFLVHEKRLEQIGHKLRSQMGNLYGTGDIFCRECGLWFHPTDGRNSNVIDYHFCYHHPRQVGRKTMFAEDEKPSKKGPANA